jgi:DNA-binding NarL/FixJ family response regulator
MIRLLIADDHGIVREGLKQLFALDSDIAVVGEAVNGGEVLEALRAGGIDLILLDMTMPGISGANLITRLRTHDACPPILVLSMHNELQIARRALTAGASGYLTKDSDPRTLMNAIRKVAAGGRFIDPVLAEKMVFDSGGAAERPPHEVLSEREFDILRLLVHGKSVNDIADDLKISNKTVSTHKARLMQKMDFHNNAELVRYAVAHGLVE